MKKGCAERFWEIDAFRGIAIIMMIVYHGFFDLNYFKIKEIPIDSLPWWLLARSTATIFIFLVGISLAISYSRVKDKSDKNLWKKYFFRGLKIFGYGLLITGMTYFFLKEGTVVFGILHFIGVAVILGYFALKYKLYNPVLAGLIIGFGLFLNSLQAEYNWLLWLGIRSGSFYSVDYFPLFPWLGVMLLGLWAGSIFFKDGRRIYRERKDSLISRPLSFLGRNSLLIYLLHQPILILIIWLL